MDEPNKKLMMAEPDTVEGEKLDILVTLVEAYEAKYFPMDLPDPVEAIKFEIERKGLTVKDLEPMIGKSNRVYEILNHKRSLTLKKPWKYFQIYRLTPMTGYFLTKMSFLKAGLVISLRYHFKRQ